MLSVQCLVCRVQGLGVKVWGVRSDLFDDLFDGDDWGDNDLSVREAFVNTG